MSTQQRESEPITVRQLLGHAPFGLVALAGDHCLDREISWAHAIDVPEPTGWLAGGELVMTSGTAFPSSGAAQANYIMDLAAAKAAGLVLSTGTLASPIAPEAIDTADRLGLPVLTIPYEVPFSAVARHVAGALPSTPRTVLGAMQRVHEAALAMAGGTLSTSETLERIAHALGSSLAILPLDGPAGSVTTDPALVARCEEVREARRARGGHLPAILRLTDKVVAVPMPAWKGRALLAAGRYEAPPLAALQHAGVVLALTLQIEATEERITRERLSLLLNAFLAGNESLADIERRLRSFGLWPGPWVVASVPRRSVEAVTAALEENKVRAAAFGLSAEAAHVLIQDTRAARTTLERIGRDVAAIGASARLDALGDITTAVLEAELARRSIKDTGAGLARYGSGTWSPFAPGSLDAARLFVEAVLGPLLENSRARPWLLPTLRAYLELDRSPTKTADALGIHRQTLVSRLQKIEQLLDRRLAGTEDVTHVWTALRLLDAVGRSAA